MMTSMATDTVVDMLVIPGMTSVPVLYFPHIGLMLTVHQMPGRMAHTSKTDGGLVTTFLFSLLGKHGNYFWSTLLHSDKVFPALAWTAPSFG